MLGSEYVGEHVVAEYNRRMEERIYRSYVCDTLKCIAAFTGTEVEYRYAELISPPKKEPEKTGDEVALEVIERLGLKVKTHGLHEVESDSDA